jgi:hypothetical protein
VPPVYSTNTLPVSTPQPTLPILIRNSLSKVKNPDQISALLSLCQDGDPVDSKALIRNSPTWWSGSSGRALI